MSDLIFGLNTENTEESDFTGFQEWEIDVEIYCECGNRFHTYTPDTHTICGCGRVYTSSASVKMIRPNSGEWRYLGKMLKTELMYGDYGLRNIVNYVITNGDKFIFGDEDFENEKECIDFAKGRCGGLNNE